MWFLNHIANPLVRLILKSPLHGLLSSGLVLMIYRGKRSGKTYELPVQYAQDGQVVYIMVGNPEQKSWWRNLRGGAPVQVVLRGQKLSGEAEVLLGQDNEAETSAALGLYLQRFPAAARSHNLQAKPDGTYSADELYTAASSTVMVGVALEQPVTEG
jgi:hypothetical protein